MHSPFFWRRLACIVLVLLVPLSVMANSANLKNAPPALLEWLPWVKGQHPELACTPNATFNQRFCAWPSNLQLRVDDQGGQFEQRWLVQQSSVITLVGDQSHWPHSVTVNGQPATVVESDNHLPQLYVDQGDYLIKGELSWPEMPQRLAIASNIGMVDLTVKSQKSHAQIKDGNVWLQKTEIATATERDTQTMEVFRFLEDGIPLTMTTIVQLKITGNAREIIAGNLVLPNTVTQALASELPAKIDADGNLHLRARSGEWTIEHHARVLGTLNDFITVKNNDNWPSQEVWGFKAATNLRQVKIEGPQVLDDSQLEMPNFYHDQNGFTLYLMEQGTHFTITERLRGQQNTESDALTLNRDLWLDFNGDGFTFKDAITGQYTSQARLNTLPLITVQSATIHGSPQIITTHQNQTGLEIRDTDLSVNAMGRIDHGGQLPINGWQTTLENTSMNIHLPPGYKAWHIGGADSVSNTWLSQWNLWSIFITLLIAGSLFKVFGPTWGLLALVTSLLTYHTEQSIFLWLAPFCLLLPLMQHLPNNWLLSVTRTITGGALFIITISVISFSVQQFRIVLYPQLDTQSNYFNAQDNFASQKLEKTRQVATYDQPMQEIIVSDMRASVAAPSPRELNQKINSNEFSQTGPAEPNWQWQNITAQWRGSVTPEQPFTFIYSPPWLTRISQLLGIFASLALVALIGQKVFLMMARPIKEKLITSSSAALALLLMVSVNFSPLTLISAVQATEYPPEYLLKKLDSEVIKQPICTPNCAAINRVTINGDTTHLTLNLIVTAATNLAFVLPSAVQWQLEQVLIDNQPTQQLLREGKNILVPLTQGSHTISVKALATSNNVNVDFNGPAYNVSMQSEQWQSRGAENGQLAQGSLALARKVEQTTQEQWNSPTIEPFVTITRTLEWNLNWTVNTVVTRIAPNTGPISLDIPLIAGENVLTDGIVVKNNAVSLTLSEDQTEFEWSSQLAVQSPLNLSYGEGKNWAELWSLSYQPRWHLETTGTPLIFDEDEGFIWQPRPGESLQLIATRPEAVSGPKVTVLATEANVQHGKRLLSYDAHITLNASVGGDYKITLPDDAQKMKVTLNNSDIHVEQDNKIITLALIPGDNTVSIHWQSENTHALITQIPKLQLETPNNNIALTLNLNSDRWPLWVWGPKLGPAMLYWGVFVVLLLSAVGLGVLCKRLKLSIPVSIIAWVLLGFGVSTLNTGAGLIVALWFFILEARKRWHCKLTDSQFNLVQIVVFIYTAIALCTLIAAIPMSLLSLPDMQVVGNNSSNYNYQWYTDHTTGNLPSAGVLHVSIWVFRLAMLAWSLWLVFALLRWAKWFWLCINEGGFWRKIEKRVKPQKTTPPIKVNEDSTNNA